jgi:F-type H+-transporting ATPase subunit a
MQIIKKYTLSVLVLLLSIVNFSYGSEHESSSDNTSKKEFNAGEMIMHHIGDSHEWHFTTINDFHATIPLLVIIYNPEKGLEIFPSSKFVDESGHSNLKEGKFGDYIIHHDKIHYVNENVHIYDFSITKNVASLLISFSLLVFIFLSIAFRYKKNPLSAPKGIFGSIIC